LLRCARNDGWMEGWAKRPRHREARSAVAISGRRGFGQRELSASLRSQ
jgi:ribosomal protein L4